MLPRFRFVLGICVVGMVACGQTDESTMLKAIPRHRGDRDEVLTPGDLCNKQNPDFDGFRYAERIPHCRREVSQDTKAAVAAAYGIYGDDRYAYEIDHFIPLNIGGSNHPRNLWPLYGPLAREKSRYELWLMNQVAQGNMVQSTAIERIRSWRPGLAF